MGRGDQTPTEIIGPGHPDYDAFMMLREGSVNSPESPPPPPPVNQPSEHEIYLKNVALGKERPQKQKHGVTSDDAADAATRNLRKSLTALEETYPDTKGESFHERARKEGDRVIRLIKQSPDAASALELAEDYNRQQIPIQETRAAPTGNIFEIGNKRFGDELYVYTYGLYYPNHYYIRLDKVNRRRDEPQVNPTMQQKSGLRQKLARWIGGEKAVLLIPMIAFGLALGGTGFVALGSAQTQFADRNLFPMSASANDEWQRWCDSTYDQLDVSNDYADRVGIDKGEILNDPDWWEFCSAGYSWSPS